MEITENIMLDAIITESLKQSMTYQEYRDLVEKLAVENDTTGHEKTEALVNYTALNHRRMKRWDKTVNVPEKAYAKIKSTTKKQTWLVLTESWCGDAAHIMPVINKVAKLNKNIDYRVVLRDKHEALMNQFLTNGGKSIPKLIMINNATGEVENTFGPRPSPATELVTDYKTKHGKLTPEFKEDLQRWYNKDKGQSTIADLLKLFS